MGAKPISVAAVTCDIIDSRRYTGHTRNRLNDAIQRAYHGIVAADASVELTKIDFRITAGDEFQFVLRKPERALEVLTLIRANLAIQAFKPIVRFRAAVGIGEVTYRPSKQPGQRPYEWDGPAFQYARDGLEEIKRQRSPDRWTALRTSNQDFNRQFDVILGLVDQLQRSWTRAQWEAIWWTLKGLNRLATARRLKVAHQNVSKRLSAAGWAPVDSALTFIQDSLTHPPAGAHP